MVKNSVQRNKDLGKNPKAIICKLLYAVRNRFKGLDLIDRVPDEQRTEVCDTKGDRDQDHPHGKESKKAKWLFERPYKQL